MVRIVLLEQEAHPRIRGEYLISYGTIDTQSGSPPHSRGIPLTALSVGMLIGLTPAFAGNTWRR